MRGKIKRQAKIRIVSDGSGLIVKIGHEHICHLPVLDNCRSIKNVSFLHHILFFKQIEFLSSTKIKQNQICFKKGASQLKGQIFS